VTLSTSDATSQVASVWQSAQTEAAFWNGIANLVATQHYEKGDVVTLLNAVRAQCSNVFWGPYPLPPVPGGPSSGAPVGMFSGWSCWLLAAVAVPASFSTGLQALGNAGLRRDAATDIARVVAAWFWKVSLFPSPIPVVLPGSPGLGWAESALNVAGSGALNLPKIGPYVGSSLLLVSTLLHAFFPGPTPPSPIRVVAGLFEQHAIDQAARGLAADGNWLASLYNTLSGAGYVQVSLTEAWQKQNILAPITQKLSDETSTLANLATLVAAIDVPGVLELLVYGVSIYVALCKQVVTTDLSLASVKQANSKTQDCLQHVGEALDDFARYRESVLGDPTITIATPGNGQSGSGNWAAQLNALVLQVAAARLSQIDYTFSLSYSTGIDTAFADGSIDDKGSPPGTTTKTFKETVAPLSTPPIPANLTGFLQDIWTPYVASVASALDLLYASHFACIQSWVSDVTACQSQLPQLPPTWSPTFGDDPWTAGVPNGAVWTAGARVQYAVIAANDTATLPGPWSAPLTVTTGSCPTMQLQPDTTGSISYYQICRQVQSLGSHGFGSTELVGVVPANAASFTDTNTVDLGTSAASPRAERVKT